MRLCVLVWLVSMAGAHAARDEPSVARLARRSPQTINATASTAAPVQPQASSLESRAQAYWARRQAKDLTGAYPYYCSAYRARVSLPQFLQMTRLVRFDLQDLRVANVTMSGDRAEVTVAYKFLLPTLGGQPLEAQAKDSWARDSDGEWCKEDEPLVLPFPQSAPPPSSPSSAPAAPRLP